MKKQLKLNPGKLYKVIKPFTIWDITISPFRPLSEQIETGLIVGDIVMFVEAIEEEYIYLYGDRKHAADGAAVCWPENYLKEIVL